MRYTDRNSETLTVTEAQKIFKMNKKALRQMMKSGKLASQKIGPQMQINKENLKTYVRCNNDLLRDDYQMIPENVTSAEMKMIADWT